MNMVPGLFLCCLLAVAAAYPARLENDTAPFQNQGVQDIINGIDSKYGWFTSILSLQLNDVNFCGATLISATRAITAAHCLDDEYTYTVQAGQLNFDQSSGHEVTRTVTEFIKHPQYNASDYWRNDIAILKFEAIPFDVFVQPAKMLTDADGDLTNDECYITGWGKTSGSADVGSSMQKHSQIKVMQNKACSNHWNGIRETNICMEYFLRNVAPYEGDGGGPLTCLLQGEQKLAGVTSWGQRDCPGTMPSVYTRVSKYQDWIAQNM